MMPGRSPIRRPEGGGEVVAAAVPVEGSRGDKGRHSRNVTASTPLGRSRPRLRPVTFSMVRLSRRRPYPYLPTYDEDLQLQKISFLA